MQKVRRYLVVKPFLLLIPLALVVSKPIAICGKDDLPNEVQKIFAQRCLNCHGPDGQEGGLRLDSQEGVLSKLDSGATAVVPGSVDGSELMRRVVTPDETLRMPPVDKGDRLTAKEIATLKSWVETGAHWNVHWSYRELVVPRPPVPQNLPWCKNEIDQFVPIRLTGFRQHQRKVGRVDCYLFLKGDVCSDLVRYRNFPRTEIQLVGLSRLVQR